MKPITEFQTTVALQLPNRRRSRILAAVNNYHTGLNEFPLDQPVPPGRPIGGKPTKMQDVHHRMHMTHEVTVTVEVMENGDLRLKGLCPA